MTRFGWLAGCSRRRGVACAPPRSSSRRTPARRAGPARPSADELRLLRRADRARPGAPRGDRLDRPRGDLRRPDVPSLLPDDRGRPCADGQRLGADRARRPPRRRCLTADPGRWRGPRSASVASCPGLAASARRACVGRANRRLRRPAPFFGTLPGRAGPLRGRLLGQRRGPEPARRAGLASLAPGRDDEWSSSHSSPPRAAPAGRAAQASGRRGRARRAPSPARRPRRKGRLFSFPFAARIGAAAQRVFGVRVGTR